MGECISHKRSEWLVYEVVVYKWVTTPQVAEVATMWSYWNVYTLFLCLHHLPLQMNLRTTMNTYRNLKSTVLIRAHHLPRYNFFTKTISLV